MGHAHDCEAPPVAKRGRLSARSLLCGLLAGLALAASGCWLEDDGETPDQVRVGVLPDEEEAVLRQRYAPLVAHLTQALDMEIRLIVPRDYADILALFAAGELDIANFGGVTFVEANEQYGAVPLVLRDIDLRFTTFFISRIEEPQATIDGFRDKSFAFGSELSTSGHFMPRHFMQARGITPEGAFASVQYSGSHDTTVYWVRDGRADLGAVNSEVVRAMLTDGRLAPGEVRVVEETPPYADYVWAVQANLDPTIVSRLRDAFMALSPDNEGDAAILSSLGAGGFLPARNSDFARLREVVRAYRQASRQRPSRSQ